MIGCRGIELIGTGPAFTGHVYRYSDWAARISAIADQMCGAGLAPDSIERSLLTSTMMVASSSVMPDRVME